MDLVYIPLAMALWGALHSLTASLAFKEKAARLFGRGAMRFYRLFYNGFSLLTFLPVMALVALPPHRVFYSVPAPWNFLMGAGQGAAAFLALLSVLQTDALHFAGIKQLFVEDSKGQLVTNGLYKIVRHPIYTFSLLFLWLTPVMTDKTLVFYLGATLYFIAGAYFEERKLLREFGEEYAEYMKSTPMLAPGLVFRK